jgi:hypothetical protein
MHAADARRNPADGPINPRNKKSGGERAMQEEAQLRAMKKEAEEREKRLDERIEKLVSAIGELIRRNGHKSAL